MVKGWSVTAPFCRPATSLATHSGMIAAGVGQVVRFAGGLVLEDDLQATMDVRHVLQVSLDDFRVEVRRLEDVGVRLEGDDRAVPAERANLLQVRCRFAALVDLPPLE